MLLVCYWTVDHYWKKKHCWAVTHISTVWHSMEILTQHSNRSRRVLTWHITSFIQSKSETHTKFSIRTYISSSTFILVECHDSRVTFCPLLVSYHLFANILQWPKFFSWIANIKRDRYTLVLVQSYWTIRI